MSKQMLAAALVAAVLAGAACSVRTRVQAMAAPPNRAADEIVGITDREGVYTMFDRAATIQGQTLWAKVRGKPFQIALASVQRYWVESSHISAGRTLGLVAGVGATAAVIAALAMKPPRIEVVYSSHAGCCLFVYSWDGRRYSFDTEAYTAAITRGLERDDYSALPQLREQEGQYRVMISNEMDESQYTNLLELWAVDHAPGVHPRVGADGTVYGISAPLAPLEARDGEGNDLRAWLEKRDRSIWEPEPAADRNGNLRREVVLTFPRPPQARQARLVASATHSLWAGETAGHVLQLLGRDLPAWYREIDGNPAARDQILGWMAREELYALRVEVEEADGWQARAMLPVAGPFVSDERVVVLDVSRATGSRLRLRVRPPAGFWAFNSFAIEYGSEAALPFTRLPLESARDEQGSDLRPSLEAADGRYHQMHIVGERAWAAFPAPPLEPGKQRTIFLHSRGYYRMHLKEDGEPDRAAFERILREPGAGARLSAERYAELRRAGAAAATGQ
jgi:hypothetical protein